MTLQTLFLKLRKNIFFLKKGHFSVLSASRPAGQIIKTPIYPKHLKNTTFLAITPQLAVDDLDKV